MDDDKYVPCTYKVKEIGGERVFYYGKGFGNDKLYCDKLDCIYNSNTRTFVEGEGEEVGVCVTDGFIKDERIKLIKDILEGVIGFKENELSLNVS